MSSLRLIDRLIELDRSSKKVLAIIGDAMLDVYGHGRLVPCQDGCMCFREEESFLRPGGAANAAVSLANWKSQAIPICPYQRISNLQIQGRFLLHGGSVIIKKRLIDERGHIVFRSDCDLGYGLSDLDAQGWRRQAMMFLQSSGADAVLISDYDKGFLDVATIQQIIDWCNDHDLPVVADAKRPPPVYADAILKCNDDYGVRHMLDVTSHAPAVVVTHGDLTPDILDDNGVTEIDDDDQTPLCVNHVGAGDCFAAHLALALAHGERLKDAAMLAHHAGRVYVQYPHNRPPWPHEIRKDIDPLGGKVLSPEHELLAALRESIPGRVVFTNGVFRIPHAGHAWLFAWAKRQGDLLVVAVNDDESARRLRPGECILPLEQRVALLAAQNAVDWVVPFGEDTPEEIMKILKPDVLVKGAEYAGKRVPGDELCETLFAPASPYAAHASDLVNLVRG